MRRDEALGKITVCGVSDPWRVAVIVWWRLYGPVGCVSECLCGVCWGMRATIVLLSPHGHKLVNGHAARPVASGRVEQWSFPVEGTLAGLWRHKEGGGKGALCKRVGG